MSKIKRYTYKELKVIFNNYKTIGNVELGSLLNRPPDGIKHQIVRFGLKRTSEEVLALRRKPNKGQFKKGNEPKNTRYDGAERVTKDGYVEVRLSKGKFRLKHLVIWEAINGKLPKGFCLRFKNSNKLNCKIENLELITRAENMKRNTIHRFPKELIISIKLIKKLNRISYE